MTWYPTLDDVVNIHVVVMDALGGSPQVVTDAGKITSALMRPQSHAHDEGADLPTRVGYLLAGLAAAHGFFDANKRTALAVTEVFLEMNGFVLHADRELEDLLVDLVAAHARGVDAGLLQAALNAGIVGRVAVVDVAGPDWSQARRPPG